MERKLKLFIIPEDKIPGGPPNPSKEFVIEAKNLDGLREVARTRIEDEHLRLRSLSFGANELIAYAEEQL
jgi:hypothetical protein